MSLFSSWKLEYPNFFRFWNSKLGTIPIKPGWLVGTLYVTKQVLVNCAEDFGTLNTSVAKCSQFSFSVNKIRILSHPVKACVKWPQLTILGRRQLNSVTIKFCKLPEKSVPKIIPFTVATDMQCQSESSRRLVLRRAVITPSLDNPSHIQMNSGELSNKRATTSPFWYPCDLK